MLLQIFFCYLRQEASIDTYKDAYSNDDKKTNLIIFQWRALKCLINGGTLINFSRNDEIQNFFLKLNEFFVYVIFFFQFRITWLYCNVLFLIKNLFDWLFTWIYLVYWSVWYSFDYYLVLTSFTSLPFISRLFPSVY